MVDASRSPWLDGEQNRHGDEVIPGVQTGTSMWLLLDPDDVPYLMGRDGQTLSRMERMSGATISVDRGTVSCKGTYEQRARAKRYCQLLTRQRKGPIELNEIDSEGLSDFCTVTVPGEAMAVVMGTHGDALRSVETVMGVLCIFLGSFRSIVGENAFGHLAIVGSLRSRENARLRVMSNIDFKLPEHYINDVLAYPLESDEDGLATERFPFPVGYFDDRRYLHPFRAKVALHAHCAVEYIGGGMLLYGIKSERSAARKQCQALLQESPAHPVCIDGRWQVLEEQTNGVDSDPWGSYHGIEQAPHVNVPSRGRARSSPAAHFREKRSSNIGKSSWKELTDWKAFKDPVSGKVWVSDSFVPCNEAFFVDSPLAEGWEAFMDPNTKRTWFWHSQTFRWFWDPQTA